MPTNEAEIAEASVGDDAAAEEGAPADAARLYPEQDRIFARVALLTRINGISDEGLEALNGWYQAEYRVIHRSRFVIAVEVTESLKKYFSSRPSVSITAEEVECFLSALSLLYYGLRSDSSDDNDVSKNKLFQRYYYTARENASALNSSVVMSNFIWACNKYSRDEFANTCLIDILLQAYPAALECFIKLGGITYLKNTIDYLAMNNKLGASTNYLLKALALLNKLDVSFKTLQTSRIGIAINGIATAGRNSKLGIDYECGNDQVKLKATDLIKKWKAIRDASQVGRIDITARRQLKKPQTQHPVKEQTELQKQQSDASDVSKSQEPQAGEQTPTGSGSFVLNILDSMVEQREKERRRKMAMKEAQRHGLFKVTKQTEVYTPSKQDDASSAPDTPTRTPQAAESTSTAATVPLAPVASVPAPATVPMDSATPAPMPTSMPSQGQIPIPPPPSAQALAQAPMAVPPHSSDKNDKAEESRKELQSLMNFFKTFKHQPAAAQGAEPQATPPMPFPPMGMVMPPMFAPLAPPPGLMGLNFQGPSYAHMNVAGGVPPLQPNPNAPSTNQQQGGQNNSGKNSENPPSIPPWR